MYKKFLLPSLVLTTGALLMVAQGARADEALPKPRNTNAFIGAESYSYLEKAGSTDLTEENGWRVIGGLGWSNLFIPTEGAVYRASIAGYVGVADYECVSQPTTCPAAGAVSESQYAGVRVEGMGGYRFGSVIGIELFSGVVFDAWYRSIADGEVNGGGTYLGYDTYNAVGSFKVGASIIQRFNRFGYFLRGGIKAPFAAWQRINIEDGVEVRPGEQLSFFANLDLTFGTLPRDRFILSFYYDSLNLTSSNPKDLRRDGVVIGTLATPASRSETLGVQMIFGF